MTAAVETMAWTGELPWHGLGTKVGADLTPDQMLKAAQLDWTVSKQQVYIQLEGYSHPMPVKNRFALTRNTDGTVFDIVGRQYVPVQNEESLAFFKQFVEAGDAKMETAGALMGGKYIWGLAKFEDNFRLGRGSKEDRVESYVLLMNPHLHGRALLAQQTSVRVVCMNTLQAALGSNKGSRVRLPHVREFTEEVREQAIEAMGLAKDQFKEFRDQAKFLAEKPATDNQADAYFKTLLKLDDNSLAKRKSEDQAELKKKIEKNRVLKLLQQARVSSPGADLPSAEGTWWGLFNSVTFVVDHQLGNDRETVLRDNWFGYRGQMKRKALQLALDVAGK